MVVCLILVVATMVGFIGTAMATGSIWASFVGAGISQLLAASVIWRINLETWNPFH